MTRKKVKLAFIANDSARKATFKKRKKGLMKKVNELSTLCGIQACAIVYSPYEAQPDVWPSPLGVQQVLTQFRKMPEMEQSKKMMNQEGFLRQRIIKATEQLKKLRKENREKDITRVMFQSLTGKPLTGLTMLDLNDLGWLVDQNVKEITKLMETLSTGNANPNPTANDSQAGEGAVSVAVAAPAPSVVGARAEEAVVVAEPVPPETGLEANDDGMQSQQWFMDMINPPNQIGFGGGPVGGVDELLLPFTDPDPNGENALWSSAFFP
ncbi:Agamous-like MADS-box protein AGL80 [Euphorbia peplus]|nr:Agamous-like MADS-box protein AGL80 [Euphorbia peplus]